MRKHTSCLVNGCTGIGNIINGVEYFTKGYCKAHYLRLYRHGDVSVNKAPKGENRKGNPLYNRYINMQARCYSPNSDHYNQYGARGITMCARWREQNGAGFRNFCLDMLPSFKPGLELDRIDVNGNYEPSNCRWATRSEQMRNLQSTRYITKDGVTKPLADWADELGLSSKLIWGRLIRGWTDEQSLEPIGFRRTII